MTYKRYLKAGEIVIFPTDTVYGLGCKIYDNEAINRIFKVKERPVDKHIPILCSSITMAASLGIFDKRALRLAEKYWPGALTIILESQDEYYKKTNNATIGIRIPNNKIALNLINDNGPLVVTSVNKSGLDPLTNIEDIVNSFKDDVDYIYEESNNQYLNISSTVVDLTTNEVKIIREGSISKEEILKTLKEE